MALLGLLEDEIDLREELEAYLSMAGHRVLCADSSAEFFSVGDGLRFDVIIVDRGLPDADGLQVIERVRRESPRTGIVMLTARGSSEDRISGLQTGADHYLVKPVSLPELGAHVSALLRRLPEGWRLDGNERCLYAPDGTRLALSAREFDLLGLIVRRGSRMASRREVAEALGWDWLSFDQRRLDTLVSRLRRRCREACGQELPIRTEHSRGYVATGAIELT
ncbi:response regulator transcription factor [Dyella sp.]|jgi:DNA-binding response OmpR family regulator